ncbi:MAG: hypothetical protein HW380_3750, partial [Magnetococcales bacterium]|nr:hypothetical protein [Magnetococcales bacterium]
NKKIRCEKIKILGLRPYPPLGGSKIKVKIKVKRKTLVGCCLQTSAGRDDPPRTPAIISTLKKRGGLNGYVEKGQISV